MDKKMKSNKNPLVRFRGWIQAAATLLTNIHIPNLFKGRDRIVLILLFVLANP